MSGFVRRLVRACVGVPLWVKAVDHVSHRDYSAALDALERFEKVAPTSDVELHALKALVLLRLGNFEACLNELAVTREHLRESKRLSEAEKNYLACYMDRILDKLRSCYSPAIDADFEGDFSTLNAAEVRRELLRTFPLS